MQKIDIGDLNDWELIQLGQAEKFEGGSRGRPIKLTFMTSDKVLVYGTHDPDEQEKLLANAEGHFELRLETQGDYYIQVESKAKGCIAMVRGYTRDQVVPAVDKIKLTKIGEKAAVNPHIQELRMIASLNERRRDEQQREELKKMRELREEMQEVIDNGTVQQSEVSGDDKAAGDTAEVGTTLTPPDDTGKPPASTDEPE